jgi:GntR family transcriptional regulator, rspAB operon transcriptional repressor
MLRAVNTGAAGTAAAPLRATEVAYQKLTGAIVRLELAPGRLVNERELAEQLGVTRLTLVAALHRMAETGLVSILARRGVLISPVDVRDAQQVFDARLGIEGQIAELAADRATAAQIDELRELAARIEPVQQNKVQGHEAFLEVDQRLHMAIADISRNQYLRDALSRIWNVNLRLWYVFFTERERSDSHFQSHHDVIEAIVRRDPTAARLAMRQHILASKELLQAGLWGG